MRLWGQVKAAAREERRAVEGWLRRHGLSPPVRERVEMVKAAVLGLGAGGDRVGAQVGQLSGFEVAPNAFDWIEL